MAEGKHESIVKDTDYFLIKDKKSDYKIVIRENASELEKEAANELVLFLKQATDVELEIINDQETDGCGKYLSVGKTLLWEKLFAGETEEKLGKCGFKIKTIDKNVYMWGDRDHGTLYSVHEFLKYEVGFGAYIPSEIYTDICDTVVVKEFCVTEVPDFEFRLGNYGFERHCAKNRLFGRRVRMMPEEEEFIYVDGAPWHNSLHYLPPEKYKKEHKKWYSDDGTQLCFNAHGDKEEQKLMFNTFMERFLHYVETNPERNNITITHQDHNTWCSCSACTADREKYGANSGTVIKFCNKVSRATKKYFEEKGVKRDLNIIFFAYRQTLNPPVKEENGKYVPFHEDVVCDDNVMVFFAPAAMHFGKTFQDEVNKEYAEMMDKWYVVSKKMILWIYTTNFNDYLIPYDSFGAMQENYRFAKEHGVNLMFDLGQWNQNICTAFEYFKAYLTAKLSWNVNADFEALTDDFFTHVYKDAAKEMKEVFFALRKWTTHLFDVIGMDGSIYFNNDHPICWPRPVCEDLLNKLDNAYKAIEPLQKINPDLYRSLYWRICLETIPYRKQLVALYRNIWYSVEEGAQLLDSLIKDVADLKIALGSETYFIDTYMCKLGPLGRSIVKNELFLSENEYFKEESKMGSCPI